ncbi:MAG: hypothetical protein LBR61_05255 [Synergistaceae bacterium]|nr:hypothetical protein [Synergistaceae bacterium]
MSGAFVREDEERNARLEAQTLEEQRAALLSMLLRERERIETDPKLSQLPASKKQKFLARIEKEIAKLQEQTDSPSQTGIS